MKCHLSRLFLTLFFIFLCFKSQAQTKPLDSLRNLLFYSTADTLKIGLLFQMTDLEGESNIDSAFTLVTQAEMLALKQNNKKWLAKVYLAKGFIFFRQSLDNIALYYFYRAIALLFSYATNSCSITFYSLFCFPFSNSFYLSS